MRGALRAVMHLSLAPAVLVLVAACHGRRVSGGPAVVVAPAPDTVVRPTPVAPPPPASPARTASAAGAASAVEFREADTVMFAGSETIARKVGTERIFVAKDAVVTSRDFRSVRVGVSPNGMPTIELLVCERAGERLGEFTSRNIRRRRLAVLADGKPLIAPLIMGRITVGVQLDGIGDMASASRLARTMEAALPVERCPPP